MCLITRWWMSTSTEDEEPPSVGAEHYVVSETIRKLGLDEKLAEMGFSRAWRDVAVGVIAGV